LCRTHGRSKGLIEQRQKKYRQKHEQIHKESNEYIKQTTTIPHLDKILDIIANLVYENQYQLRVELERRRGMLKYNAYDHRFVQAFYDLKP
jgi:hypothetical protein